MKQEVFTLTKNHIKLLRSMFVNWQEDETGAPEIDPKRPYGNSAVNEDVANILKIKFNSEDGLTESQNATLSNIHRETEKALQIVLVTGKFKVGTYCKQDEYDSRSWILKK